MKIVSLVGNRPQFIKEAVVHRALKDSRLEELLVHSGQHYDANMSDVFFDTLGIRSPHYNIGAGSGTHAEITARVMLEFERIVRSVAPGAILVYGDTDTTLAGALVAAKEKIPLVHVEAGIRMLPRTMPEEINRVLTDRIADFLFAPTKIAQKNLEREANPGKIFMVGDVMYDLFNLMRPNFKFTAIEKLGLPVGKFIVVTLHREANVDCPRSLRAVLEALHDMRDLGTIVFPMHPRTRKRVSEFALNDLLKSLCVIDPVDYLDLMGLVSAARFVITDSGGLQKEAFFAGKRAIVLLEDAGWRELTDCGWNILATPQTMGEAARKLRDAQHPGALYGEGDAGRRIVTVLEKELSV